MSAIEITQADREAVADWFDRDGSFTVGDIKNVREGLEDDFCLVQTFARHRIASEADLRSKLGELSCKLRLAREALQSIAITHPFTGSMLTTAEVFANGCVATARIALADIGDTND